MIRNSAGTPEASRKVRIWLTIVAFGLLLRVPYLFHRMQDLDEGSHAAIATVLLDGGVPFRDAVNNKFPGVYWVYAMVFAVCGNYNMGAVHAVTLACTMLTAFLLHRFAARLGRPDAGPWAAFFYLTFTTLFPQNLAANAEIFMALPYTAAVYALWQGVRNKRAWSIAVAGLLAGVATIFKQVGGMAWAAGLVFLAWCALISAGSKLKAMGWAACFTLGFATPLVLLGLYFWQQGCLEDFLFWTLTYISKYLKTSHQRLNFAIQFGACFLPFALSCGVLWLAAGWWFTTRLARWRERPPATEQVEPAMLLAAWAILSVAATFTGQRMYPHYYIQYLPALCLVAALGVVEWPRFREVRSWRRTVVFGSILPALGSLLWAVFYVAETPPALGRPDPDFRPAAEYVRRNTDPEDRLFVWGWFTPLYVHSERKPGTRFVYAQVFVNYRPEYVVREKFRWIADTAVTWVEIPEAWDMLEEDFRRHPPEVLLDTSVGNYNKFGNFPIADFPRLAAIVRDKYRHEATVSGVGIYRLKNERSPTLARPEHVPASREASVARSRPGRAAIGLRIEASESRQTLPPLSGVTTRPRAAEVVR